MVREGRAGGRAAQLGRARSSVTATSRESGDSALDWEPDQSRNVVEADARLH